MSPTGPDTHATAIINDEVLSELQKLKERGTPIYNSGDETVRLLVVLLASQTFAPFWSAFISELGRQASETTTEVMHRIRLRRRGHRVSVEVRSPGASAHDQHETAMTEMCNIRLEFDPDQLSDAARVALLNIDLTSLETRGVTFRWDSESFTWITLSSGETNGQP